MTISTRTKVLFSAVNLLVAATPVAAHQLTVTPAQGENEIASVNAESLKSIESSWIKVPASCKARGFHASPTPFSATALNQDVQNVYASFGA